MNDWHLFRVVYELPEAGYLIRQVIAPDPYHGAVTATWVVRDPVTRKKLKESETETQARQWCREREGREAA